MLFHRNAAAPIVKPHDPRMRLGDRCQHCRAATVLAEAVAALLAGPILQTKKVLQDICMFLDWTNWTFRVTALALIAFGFNLRVIYEQWRFWKTHAAAADALPCCVGPTIRRMSSEPFFEGTYPGWGWRFRCPSRIVLPIRSVR